MTGALGSYIRLGMAEKTKSTHLGRMQKRVLAHLTEEYATVTTIWRNVKLRWPRKQGTLDRMRVANALRGLRNRGLILARQAGEGSKAPWEYARYPVV